MFFSEGNLCCLHQIKHPMSQALMFSEIFPLSFFMYLCKVFRRKDGENVSSLRNEIEKTSEYLLFDDRVNTPKIDLQCLPIYVLT